MIKNESKEIAAFRLDVQNPENTLIKIDSCGMWALGCYDVMMKKLDVRFKNGKWMFIRCDIFS